MSGPALRRLRDARCATHLTHAWWVRPTNPRRREGTARPGQAAAGHADPADVANERDDDEMRRSEP